MEARVALHSSLGSRMWIAVKKRLMTNQSNDTNNERTAIDFSDCGHGTLNLPRIEHFYPDNEVW